MLLTYAHGMFEISVMKPSSITENRRVKFFRVTCEADWPVAYLVPTTAVAEKKRKTKKKHDF